MTEPKKSTVSIMSKSITSVVVQVPEPEEIWLVRRFDLPDGKMVIVKVLTTVEELMTVGGQQALINAMKKIREDCIHD